MLTFRLVGSPWQNSQSRQSASDEIPVSFARVARRDETRAKSNGNGGLDALQWLTYARKAVRVNKQARRSARPTIPATASLWIGCTANRRPAIACASLQPGSTYKSKKQHAIGKICSKSHKLVESIVKFRLHCKPFWEFFFLLLGYAETFRNTRFGKWKCFPEFWKWKTVSIILCFFSVGSFFDWKSCLTICCRKIRMADCDHILFKQSELNDNT